MSWNALFHPYAGYLHLCARTVAALAGGVPARWAPLCYNAMALILAAFCCSEFARTKYRVFLANDILRVVLCLAMSAAFPSYELVGNLANLQWFIVVAVIPFALAAQPSPNDRVRLLYVLAGLFLSFSAPALLILVPLLLLQGNRSGFMAFPVALLGGLTVQVVLFVTSPVAASASIRIGQVVKATLVALSNQVILPCLLGQRHAYSLVTKGSVYAGPVSLLVFAGVLIYLGVSLPARERLKLVAAIWLMISSLGLALASREGLQTLLLDFSHAIRFGSDRYFFCACCLFSYCMALAVASWGRSLIAKPERAAAFVLLFAMSGIVNFRIGPLKDLNWPAWSPVVEDWRNASRKGTPYGPVSIPVNPEAWRLELPALTASADHPALSVLSWRGI